MLDTNVLVGGAFRPRSASGRLLEAVRAGRLCAVWTAATRAEAEQVLARIPPLRALDVAGLFPEAGRLDAPREPGKFDAVPGTLDRVFAALAHAADAPLVTSDAPLVAGARVHGVAVLSPTEAATVLL